MSAKTMKIKKNTTMLLMCLSLAAASVSVFAGPSRCPSISALKAQASTKGLKMYGDRYIYRHYSKYDTGQEWEFVITNNAGTNAKNDLKEFKSMATLSGRPKPREKMGEGTWFCDYRMNGHTVVANYPALCDKEVCAR